VGVTGVEERGAEAGGRRRRRWPIIAPVVLVVVVVGFLLGREVYWSLRPVPEFASLVTDPDPSLTGTVAFQEVGADNCVWVVPASGGAARKVTCLEGFAGGGTLRWLPDGRLQDTRYPRAGSDESARSVIIDVRTGATTDVPAAEIPPAPAWQEHPAGPGGETIDDRSRRGRLTVSLTADGRSRELLSVGAPSTYSLGQWAWSADGSFVVAKDDTDRLLLITTGDPSKTRVLAEGGWGAAVTGRTFSASASTG